MWPPDQSPSGSILARFRSEGERPSLAQQTRHDWVSAADRVGGGAPRWPWNGDWHVQMASVELGQPVERRSGDYYCVGSDGLHEMPRTDEVQSVR